MLKKPLLLFSVLILCLAPALRAQTGFHIIHAFTPGGEGGSRPGGSLVYKSPYLYGMTQGDGLYAKGTIFRVKVDGSNYQVLHHFGDGAADGQPGYDSLALSGSTLYGTTQMGGEKGNGTIFRINIDGSGYRVLHSFLLGSVDGRSPFGMAPTVIGTALYGTTMYGGTADLGTVWKIGTNGTGFKVLHSFTSEPEGAEPVGSLLYSGTKLYGMTMYGGSAGYGTIYRLSPAGTGYGIIHSFTAGATDGQNPYMGGKLAVSNGILYGLTQLGGVSGYGVVFKVATSGKGFQVIHSFAAGPADGYAPMTSVVLIGTKLYGTVYGGGLYGSGVLFGVSTSGLNYQVLHNFEVGDTSEGVSYGMLTKVVSTSLGTRLYGMTSGEGTTGKAGCIFYYKLK